MSTSLSEIRRAHIFGPLLQVLLLKERLHIPKNCNVVTIYICRCIGLYFFAAQLQTDLLLPNPVQFSTTSGSPPSPPQDKALSEERVRDKSRISAYISP